MTGQGSEGDGTNNGVNITFPECVKLVDQLLKGTNLFGVVNVKKDGSTRTWRIHPKAGREHLVGKDMGPPPPNMRRVFDMHAAQPRLPDGSGRFGAVGADGWRSLNLETIVEIHYRGKRYVVTTEPPDPKNNATIVAIGSVLRAVAIERAIAEADEGGV